MAPLIARAAAATSVVALLACAPPTEAPVSVSPEPPRRPDTAAAPSPESAAVRRHFAAQEESLLARGMLRTDDGSADSPFSQNTLVENFVRIALFDEYTDVGGRLVSRDAPSVLRRWSTPVRMRLEIDPAVSREQRARDRESVREFAARLRRITGHSITVLDEGSDHGAANFHILVLNEDTRRQFGAELAEMVPGVEELALRTITGMPRSVSCLVLGFTRGDTATYSHAVAVIRAELPDLTRLSCFHEELAQGLGLPNDSDDARPSIFNDREEFALLTEHDELLLQILYDPRLEPGMDAESARPLVRRIASELMGGES